MSGNRRSRIVSALGGVAAALIVCESVLRLIASPYTAGRPYEYRQYHEGFAVSHFAPDGERLTGNPPLADARNIVILGDSTIEAVSVPDEQTTGALLEKELRSGGSRVNVHQYGYPGATAPLYLKLARQVLARWNPDTVVVVLDREDILLSSSEDLRIVRGADGEARLVEDTPAEPGGTWRGRMRRTLVSHSVLAYEGYLRAVRIIFGTAETGAPDPGPSEAEWSWFHRSLVRMMREAYGQRLVLVYEPYLHGPGLELDNANENAFLNACREEGVHCVSSTAALLKDRVERQRVARGFSNSVPGIGHLNQTGHQILARIILEAIRQHPQAGR